MMTILNCISLTIILVSMLVLLLHRKIKMPIYVDVIAFILIIGTSAVLVNTMFNSDLNGHLRNAEILCRFGFALLLSTFTVHFIRCGGYESENDERRF